MIDEIAKKLRHHPRHSIDNKKVARRVALNIYQVVTSQNSELKDTFTGCIEVVLDFYNQHVASGCLGCKLCTGEVGSNSQPTSEQSATEGEKTDSISEEDLRQRVTCGICFENMKDVAFECGHQTCWQCYDKLRSSATVPRCPSCRQCIRSRPVSLKG